MRRRLPLILVASLMCAGASAAAPAPQPPQPQAAKAPANLPEWDRLSREQRELLLAPMRDRWNSSPDSRARMYEHAQRWHSMTPEQRERARRGNQRWDHMDPQQRMQARALFEKMRDMPPDQRRALRDQWKAMTPEQRQDWVRTHPPMPRDGSRMP
jgi:hypothetical protein